MVGSVLINIIYMKHIFKAILPISFFFLFPNSYAQNEFVRNGQFYPASNDIHINNDQRDISDFIGLAKDGRKAFVILSRVGDSFMDKVKERVQGQVTFLLGDKSFIYLNDYSEYYIENKSVSSIYKLTESEVNRILSSEVLKVIYFVPESFTGRLTRVSASGPYSNPTFINYMFDDKPKKKEPFIKEALAELFGDPSDNKITDELKAESKPVGNNQYINLVKDPSGVFTIPVILNNVLKINFIIDSGASSVVITADVAITLLRTGTLAKTDFIGDAQYKLADGSILSSKDLIIRNLKIGNLELTNVRATISTNISGDLLLGQSALTKLGKYMIDVNNCQLIIER
jgi:clan AA aspartic protease (TIGR02281 family)